MGRVAEIYVNRDNFSEDEAVLREQLLREEMFYAAEHGDYEGAEELLLSEGFELDYVFDLLI